jgi:glycerol-3-phosphate acyltransferase PlsY
MDFFKLGFIGKYINELAGGNGTVQLAVLLIASLFIIAVAYVLGSLNFAIIISGKTYKQDIRNYGSKNAGMTNMMRTYGKKAAVLTLLGDAAKAAVAALVGYTVLGHMGAYIAGFSCVLGHMFPVFYKFKGGKGVVTAAVSILMCNPLVFLIVILIFVIIVGFTKYISLGSIMCALMYPFILNAIDRFFHGGCPIYAVLSSLLISVLLLYKHRENFKRLREGKESKFSFKKSVKPEEIAKKEDK